MSVLPSHARYRKHDLTLILIQELSDNKVDFDNWSDVLVWKLLSLLLCSSTLFSVFSFDQYIVFMLFYTLCLKYGSFSRKLIQLQLEVRIHDIVILV